MVDTASDGGISLLMMAEKNASEEIAKARSERGEKMKRAKAEAEQDIEAYRTEQENIFQLKSASDGTGSTSKKLSAETDKEIAAMKKDFSSNNKKVISMMMDAATNVVTVVPEARKRGN